MRFPLLKLFLLAFSLCIAAAAHADTVTVGTPGSGGNPDFTQGSVVYVINTSVAAGYTFTSISFTDFGQPGTPQFFTPELFTGVSSGGISTFTLVATGSQLTIPPGSGGTVENISDPFGSYVTTADTYFGFEEVPYGGVDDAVSFNYTNTPSSGGTFLFDASSPYSASNTSFTSGSLGALNGRDYLITATASTVAGNVAATPEPSALVLMGTGLLGLAGAARRRLLKA